MDPQTQVAPELELRDYLRVLRRRKVMIGLAVAVVVGAAVTAAEFQTPVYQATAQVLLQTSSLSLFNPSTGQGNDPARQVQTQIQVINSSPVKRAVATKLGMAPGVSVQPVGQTDVIDIRANSTDANRAELVANAYAAAYID